MGEVREQASRDAARIERIISDVTRDALAQAIGAVRRDFPHVTLEPLVWADGAFVEQAWSGPPLVKRGEPKLDLSKFRIRFVIPVVNATWEVGRG